jgi:hypothetical protein
MENCEFICKFSEDDTSFTIRIGDLNMHGVLYTINLYTRILKSSIVGFSALKHNNIIIYLSSGIVFNLAESLLNDNSHKFIEFANTTLGDDMITMLVACLNKILSSNKSGTELISI